MRLALDPHPFARGGSVAIVTISLVHVSQAVVVHLWPLSARATDIMGGVMVLHFIHMTWLPCLPLLLYLSSVLALFGALFQVGWMRLIVFVPQNLLLGAMAFGGVIAMIKGAYLDGTPMTWPHIYNDQIWVAAMWVVHSSAILRRCWDPNG
jgi:hypothetical protein